MIRLRAWSPTLPPRFGGEDNTTRTRWYGTSRIAVAEDPAMPTRALLDGDVPNECWKVQAQLFQCLTLIESGMVSTFAGFDESATLRVKAAVSSRFGVPEISPVAEPSVRPCGSEP